MEPTSEQELKQLFDDGKIDQAEYEQLLEAMKSKQRSGKQVKHPKLSRKKTKLAAILYTALMAIFLWMSFLLVNSQALRNKSFVVGVGVVTSITFGISALRYWIAYWTYKDTPS